METNGEDTEIALAKYCESFPYQTDIVEYAGRILSGVKRERSAIDEYLGRACEHWRLNRITYVDASLLRIAVYEMLFSQDVPPKVAIDEAIELGKKYGNEDSKEFINGILDRILRDFYGKIDLHHAADQETKTGTK